MDSRFRGKDKREVRVRSSSKTVPSGLKQNNGRVINPSRSLSPGASSSVTSLLMHYAWPKLSSPAGTLQSIQQQTEYKKRPPEGGRFSGF
jgi:hypothetical protein